MTALEIIQLPKRKESMLGFLNHGNHDLKLSPTSPLRILMLLTMLYFAPHYSILINSLIKDIQSIYQADSGQFGN